jgi:hypothetical protein
MQKKRSPLLSAVKSNGEKRESTMSQMRTALRKNGPTMKSTGEGRIPSKTLNRDRREPSMRSPKKPIGDDSGLSASKMRSSQKSFKSPGEGYGSKSFKRAPSQRSSFKSSGEERGPKTFNRESSVGRRRSASKSTPRSK